MAVEIDLTACEMGERCRKKSYVKMLVNDEKPTYITAQLSVIMALFGPPRATTFPSFRYNFF